MARVLITGVSGFVGSHLARALSTVHQVTGTIGTSKSSPIAHAHALDLAHADAIRALLGSVSPEIVIHCAALSRVLVCEDHPATANVINTLSTAVIAGWCADHRVRLIYFSSDQVFSGERGMYTESDLPHPINVYGRTKFEAEDAALRGSTRTVVVRSNSIIGGTLGWGESFTDWVKGQTRVAVKFTLFHDQYRSPIHIRDLCELVTRLCGNDYNGVLHVGGPERLSRLETATKVLNASGQGIGSFEPASYRSHPRARIMPADTSYQLRDVLHVMPELASCDIGSRLVQEEHGVRPS